jgi:ferredoxin--NADP+ reductase
MTYVIASTCTREGDCVEVCPVDCIVPGPKGNADWPLFYIDPDVCIDCGACQPVCPPEAIYPDFELPADEEPMTQTNADYFKSGPGYYEFDLEEQRGMP